MVARKEGVVGGRTRPQRRPWLVFGSLKGHFSACREPICIAAKSELPRYDERFKGYGLNKVQHSYHLAALGARFMVRVWAGS